MHVCIIEVQEYTEATRNFLIPYTNIALTRIKPKKSKIQYKIEYSSLKNTNNKLSTH